MFTGLIEDIGMVADVVETGGARILAVESPHVLSDLSVDDSIALNGCCQTVISLKNSTFTVTAVEETLRKTTLGRLTKGDAVNLERSLKADGRLGGHFVLGHIDCVGTVSSVERRESSSLLTIAFPPEFGDLVIPVGSIAIDGVSLTTAEVTDSSVTVSVIPHTEQKTTLGRLREGDDVNIEFDMLGKYIKRQGSHAEIKPAR